MQDQLLHAPVEQRGDVEQVFRRAGDFVDPAELLELFPGLAEHAEQLALQAELVDPPRVGVGCEQHLIGPGRDAQRPGRTRRHGQRAARGLELDEVGPVADRRTRRRIVRHIDPHLAQERAVAIEDLDAAIAAVGYIDVAPGIRGDAVRRMELAGLVAAVAPRLEPVAAAVDLRDAGVDVAVADVGVAGGIPGDVGDLAEAAVLGRPRRAGVLQRPGFFIGGFLLAAEQHRHPPPRIEKQKDCKQGSSHDIHCVTSVVAGAPMSLTMKTSALAVTLALGFLDTTCGLEVPGGYSLALTTACFPAKSARSCVIRSLPTERGGVDCAAAPPGSDAMSTIATNIWLMFICPPLPNILREV